MPAFICNTCATQFTPTEEPPARCPICDEERQYVPPTGQAWTTHDALTRRFSVSRFWDHIRSSGAEAIKLARRRRVDAWLIAADLDDMSGHDLVELLRTRTADRTADAKVAAPEDRKRALDPARSAVVEACAGSGKTWMLVSRVIRLMLAGAAPSQILAITFTRKAAQEMAARLRDWLYELATADDARCGRRGQRPTTCRCGCAHASHPAAWPSRQ